jgi:predicted acylesterase/phospholipase RssA
MLIPPRRIVLSGGGIRALAHLGALTVLEKKGLLKSVRSYVGVSAGAFVGFSLMLGYTLQELRTLCTLFDFTLIRHLDPESAFEFPTSFGFDSGERLVRLLHSLLNIKKQPLDITFGQWEQKYPKGIQLRCYATDLFRTEAREFSAKVSPNVSIVDALRASMSLPGYFTPVRDPETNHMLVDGGILHNFPLAFLPEEEKETSLGITFSYDHTRVDTIEDLPTFFGQIFACYYIPRTYEVYDKYKERCIIIPCGEVPSWDFEISKEQKEAIIALGEKKTIEFLEQFSSVIEKKKPIRRYSVA